MKWCIRAVYTSVLTGEKLHSISAKIDIFRLALTVDSGNKAAHYWLIYSMVKRDADELAKAQMQIAQEELTDEDYCELVNALTKAKLTSAPNLFRKGK